VDALGPLHRGDLVAAGWRIDTIELHTGRARVSLSNGGRSIGLVFAPASGAHPRGPVPVPGLDVLYVGHDAPADLPPLVHALADRLRKAPGSGPLGKRLGAWIDAARAPKGTR